MEDGQRERAGRRSSAVTTTKGYGSRHRRRDVIAAVAALAWALAAAAVVLFVPLGTSVSVEAVETVEGVDGVEGDESAEAVSGTSTRSSYTLLEDEGPGLLVVLAIPVVLAVASVVGAVTNRAWLSTGAAGLLFVGVLLGAASIGLFFAPAAVVALVAALWTAADRDGEGQQERR